MRTHGRAAKRDAIQKAFAPKSGTPVKDSPKVSRISTKTEGNADSPNLLSVQRLMEWWARQDSNL